MRAFSHIDWWLLSAALLVTTAGIVTMNSFSGENYFFENQLIWMALSVALFLFLSVLDLRFLRRTNVVVALYVAVVALLVLVFFFGEVVKGAQSRFDLGAFALQPSDPAKLALILILAKYFTRRHIEIAHIRHILVSGAYALILFALIFLQPDFGSALIIFSIWLGMVLIAGISKKHLAGLLLVVAVVGVGLWNFGLADYQKDRIVTFLHPLADIQGAGYNAYQSTIAVGSGEILGKGVGYGTQSKLAFLPEYQTDFIFAAFAEEWGFLGVLSLFALYGIIFWRIIKNAVYGETNFEVLFSAGVAVFFFAHFVIHIGMNMGLLPVTGTTIPFMSYGGSHLLTEFMALGIITAMSRYRRTVHRDLIKESDIVLE